MVRCSKHAHVLTHLVHPCHGSLLPSTVFNTLALVNIIHVHAHGRTLTISAKLGSAAHFSTSTASAGLQHLLVCAHVHLVWFRAASRYVWPLSRVNVSRTSHINGWLKVAFGICCLGKTCRRHVLPGGMFKLLQRGILGMKVARNLLHK